jgi:hypothetical protein
VDLKPVSKVRISHGGEPLKGRILEVSTSIEDFETPTRVPTTTEVNAKIRTHFDEPWDNLVFEITNRFNNAEQIQKLHRKNGAFARKRREITAQVDKFRGYSITKYHPQIPHGVELTDRDIRTFIDLQLESGCDVISIPEPTPISSTESFQTNLEKFWEYISNVNPNVAIMPYISLRQENESFEAKLGILSEHEHTLWCIGIRFASPQEYRPNLLSLAEFSSKDFWIHCSAGRRYPNWQQPNAQLHALQRFGIDTVAVEVPQPPRRSTQERGVDSVRYFDRKTITYPHIRDALSIDGHLACNCPACRKGTLKDIISRVEGFGPSDELQLRVNDISKVHEVYASTEEFDVSKERIKENSLSDYFKIKKGLRPFISLNDF